MKTVIITSKNPIKIKAVEDAFKRVFPDGNFTFEAISVPSGVSNQPMSDDETKLGAKNRVQAAKKERPGADYWLGLEGGVAIIDEGMESIGWVAIEGNGLTGLSRAASFLLPPPVVKLINEGKELGEADDIVFKQKNSKQVMGAVGLLTHGKVMRSQEFEHTVVHALIPFMNRSLYE